MKKILIMMFFFLTLQILYADTEKNITDDSTIKYKWYHDIVSDYLYYPKGSILDGYHEDLSQFVYGEYSEWDKKYCDYDSNLYDISTKGIFVYDELAPTKYIKLSPHNESESELTCFYCLLRFDISYEGKLISYEKEVLDNNVLILTLDNEYDSTKLSFNVNTKYAIDTILSFDYEMTQQIITYYMPKSLYYGFELAKFGDYTTYLPKESDTLVYSKYIKNSSIGESCRVRSINTYRYKLAREYYDNNYYSYIEGYFPDINNYLITYNKIMYTEPLEIIKETVKEITKEVEIPVIEKVVEPVIEKEYIYIKNDDNQDEAIQDNTDSETVNENQKNNESDDESNKETVYIDRYLDKIIYKIPTKIYLIILSLSIIDIITIIFYFKKCVD